jgi:hypothetical protein
MEAMEEEAHKSCAHRVHVPFKRFFHENYGNGDTDQEYHRYACNKCRAGGTVQPFWQKK